MQTSVADSTSAVADPIFNDLLHNAEIHLTTEKEYSKSQTVDFIYYDWKQNVEGIGCAFFSYIYG